MRSMSRVWARALAVGAAMVGIVAVEQLVLMTTPFEVHVTWLADRPLVVALDALWVVAVVVLMVRQPANELWKIILLWQAAASALVFWYLPVEPHVIPELWWYLIGDVWAAVFIHLILAYPSGHFRDRLDRRIALSAYAVAIGAKVVFLTIEPADCWVVCGNPFRFFPSEPAWRVLQIITIVVIVGFLAISIVELARHWRAAGPSGRRQISPMLIAAPVWAVTVFAAYFADMFLDEAARTAAHSMNLLGVVQEVAIPLAILVGALRSTLARASVADLAVRLGEGVPVGSLRPVLARAMRDPSLQLAFPAPDGEGFVDEDGRPTEPESSGRSVATIRRSDGEVLALLIHDPALDAEDPGLVAAVGSVARLSLENERLSAQVRAQLEDVRESRARLVEAGDAERRRIERDLHDGAQQRLTALAIRLQTARATMPEAADLLDETTAELQAAIGDVRDLARGVHPTLLHEVGLAAAIDALAERATIPVEVDIPEGRLPEPVEATAYFVMAEALTNVSKYAGAARARVTARVEGDRLVASVEDDGQGGADPSLGSGLRGLADRVAAARGRFDVSSPAGGGTTVRFELPLA
jgi:signal transduction histidine kinase